MSYLSEQKQDIEIKQKIHQVKDQLLAAIQIAFNQKYSYGDLEESQFCNLLEVAQTTESTEVIKNFLRYQLGCETNNSLAATIIQDIDNKIQALAKKIAEEVKTEKFNSIWLELIRCYLNYGLNHLQFINSSHLRQIEQSIRCLSREEQLWLVERIIHNIRISKLGVISNNTPESIEQQLINMANDPAIQAELVAINQEFANTEMDGLIEE